jgi:hypothetical protein
VIIERQSGDTWVGARLIAELLAQGVQLANANQRSPLKYLFNESARFERAGSANEPVDPKP